MKFWEALKAIEEGKKVRAETWYKSEYISLDEEMDVVTHLGCIYHPTLSNAFLSLEWKIYKEPQKTYTFTEVIQGLKEGKKFKRKDWRGHWELRNDGQVICGGFKEEDEEDEEEIQESVYLCTSFTDATDWIEVKENC